MSPAALAAQQQALLAALAVGNDALPVGIRGLRGLRSEDPSAGLRAYRRHAQVLADKALAAVFPRLRELLGEGQFAAMAWAFWRRCPPQGELGAWGQDLPGFLSAQPGMDEGPPTLARLEWALHQAERAADAELDAGSLQLLAQADPARLALRLRPGLQLLPPRQLVWRLGWRAQARELPAAQADFIARLLSGLPLGTALEGCLSAHADFDFAQWLQQALQEEWLMAVTPHED